jgi:hypothetical protein
MTPETPYSVTDAPRSVGCSNPYWVLYFRARVLFKEDSGEFRRRKRRRRHDDD